MQPLLTTTNNQRLREAILREKAERHLGVFLRQAWPVIEPNKAYAENWHVDYIAEHLKAVQLGQLKRLIINIPPRHLKSILATVSYPAWAWTNRPSQRFIRVSYSADLSQKHNVLSRDLIRSNWYQRNWGDVFKLKSDTNRMDYFKNDHQGLMFATSTGGTLTGEGADVIIIDDAQNPKQANSEAERQHAINFFTQTLQSRLNDPDKGAFVVIMQRLHENDLTGHILASDLGYLHLNLPAEAPTRTVVTFPLSGREIVREAGDILDAERFSRDTLALTKKAMGSLQYAGQYLQNPAPADGAVFKREWFSNRYKPHERPSGGTIIQTWDLPFKKSEGSAECAGLVMQRSKGRVYIIDLIHEQMAFTETVRAIKDMSAKHPKARAKVIEDKANGPAVMDFLKGDLPGMIAYNPRGSKEERAISVTPYWEAGDVFLPEDAPWVQDFIEQHVMFPRGTLKDIVDATTQGTLYLMDKPGASLPPAEMADQKGSYWAGI